MGLASLSLTAIAQIALVRIWEGESLEEGVSTAITLLEVAECGQLGLGTEDSYHLGNRPVPYRQTSRLNCPEEVAQIPKVTWPRDEHRRKLLEPFETWLRILIPLGDRWKSRADEKCNASFKAFLIKEVIRHEHPEFSAQRLAKEAEVRIDEMKRYGIPHELFRAAILWFHHWRRKDISASRRVAGKKGRERSPFRKATKVAT